MSREYQPTVTIRLKEAVKQGTGTRIDHSCRYCLAWLAARHSKYGKVSIIKNACNFRTDFNVHIAWFVG